MVWCRFIAKLSTRAFRGRCRLIDSSGIEAHVRDTFAVADRDLKGPLAAALCLRDNLFLILTAGHQLVLWHSATSTCSILFNAVFSETTMIR